MARKIFTIAMLVIMVSLGGIKIFTRPLFPEGEAGAAYVVTTYMPALNMFLYRRGNGNIYEAHYGEDITLEERAGFVDPKPPIRFYVIELVYFQDGSLGYPLYEWIFIDHIWQIEGYLLPFLAIGVILVLFERHRKKGVNSQ